MENVHASYFMIRALASKNKTTRYEIKRYAETGSIWRPPFPRLKYDVVTPTLIIEDSWLLSSILIHLIKSWLNPHFLRQASKKEWLKESNVFSMPTVTIYPLMLKTILISNIFDLSLPPSPMNLFFTHTVCWHDIE